LVHEKEADLIRDAYTPKHPRLCAAPPSELFCAPLLEALAEGKRPNLGKLLRHTTEEAEDVYSCAMLQPQTCSELLEEMHAFKRHASAQSSEGSGGNVGGHPNDSFALQNAKLKPFVDSLMANILRPFVQTLFQADDTHFAELDWNYAYM
jgi:hypothetical protein